MKNKIELYEITRADIRNILKDILDVGKVLEKLQGIENKLYFLYRIFDGETEYGVYEKNNLPYDWMHIVKYSKPIKDLKLLVKKIENDNYSLNNLIDTTIKKEIFCTSISPIYFFDQLKDTLNKVGIDYSELNLIWPQECVSFNTVTKKFSKFATWNNYKGSSKFKVSSKIFVKSVKKVLEEYYNSNQIPIEILKAENIKTKGNKMQNKENPGISFSSLKGAISDDLHNEGFSTVAISTILGMYENFLKFGQNAYLDEFKKEEISSIIKIYDKYFKEDSDEDPIEDESNEIFGNNESLKKEDYFLISEIDGVQKLLPKTFETIDEVENYIKEYLSDPSRIGMIVHILKKDKSVISEIQIKELTDG